jgi:hypothetical protein
MGFRDGKWGNNGMVLLWYLASIGHQVGQKNFLHTAVDV